MAPATEEFLLKEYEHFADSFWRTEELGEKRVNFFISLVTAVVAGLVALAREQGRFSARETEWLCVGAGGALLLIGLFTFMRMVRRNEVTDQYKRAMGLIRAHFTHGSGFEGYVPFEPEKVKRRLGTGGLAQTVALLNSLIVAATIAVGSLTYTRPSRVAIPALAGFVLSLGCQFGLLRRRYRT